MNWDSPRGRSVRWLTHVSESLIFFVKLVVSLRKLLLDQVQFIVDLLHLLLEGTNFFLGLECTMEAQERKKLNVFSDSDDRWISKLGVRLGKDRDLLRKALAFGEELKKTYVWQSLIFLFQVIISSQ